MITVISGSIGSGSSDFALKYTANREGKKYYIATMRVTSDDDKALVEKSRAKREGLSFVTIEQDVAIVKSIDKIKWMESLLGMMDSTPSSSNFDENEGAKSKRIALVEDLQTLAFNEMFLSSGEIVPHKDVENTILFGIAFLKEFFDDIVIVTDGEFESDIASGKLLKGISEEGITEYTEAMKELNAAVLKFSQENYSAPFTM